MSWYRQLTQARLPVPSAPLSVMLFCGAALGWWGGWWGGLAADPFGLSDPSAAVAEPLASPSASPLTARVRRRPVALVPLADRLLVANQQSGTLSVIEAGTHRVVDEFRVARRLAHAAPHPGRADALVLDDARHRLLAVSRGAKRPVVTELASLPAYPIRLAVQQRPNRVFVSSLWSRCLTILEFDDAFERPVARRRVELPFPPREMLLLNERDRLLVADAFGGRLAALDLAALDLARGPDMELSDAAVLIRDLPAHNIRGLAASPDGRTLYVSQQALDSEAWTDLDSVHWGILMANTLRAVQLEALLDPAREVLDGAWLEQHGLVGSGAGDPGPVWLDSRGRLAVALAGVSKVAVTGASFALTLPVGHRPQGLASIGDALFVANQLDDSVTVIDLDQGEVRATVRLGPVPPPTARDRGERFFFDARLSHDGWMSCHSCHSEGHTIGQLADTKGDGGYGAPKRIPSLLGTKATQPWAWDGSSLSLEAQIRQSIRTTMHGSDPSDKQVRDLAAYLNSLAPPPPRVPADTPLARRGRAVFEQAGCAACHRRPNYTSAATYDVQLRDESGRREFNPPSLRGVGQRDRFFHDGRAESLEEVVLKLRHQLPDALDRPDVEALLAFLKGL